ncbi:glycerophosphoryl diester phosphodiesterase family protein [Drechmeria coniospora]|uniref:glycerophosphodiester phosphodiesterase n=1 Tax=Drechmeria coniospora TaxID=98403 RepID=A0A151GBG9_DRECN|nr:glycerophosphoryl diester phosphodiesterase family protein [Drechmeria coniospora]KYK54394.1 glycerophosphoryl diester phosphodiesterase family protein [Drechmeria coniospora]
MLQNLWLVLAVYGIAAVSAVPRTLPMKQIELGPRPYFLVDSMTEGPLKSQLEKCKEKPMKSSKWSIGHRGGAPLQFPEHSRESNLAGARMGAGVLECDVSFTKDRALVCRHSQCDLHTTTNIVTIPELNAKCTQPFRAAAGGKAASAKCCTSDITLEEFKSLCAKMDSFNSSATNPVDFLGGIPGWRTSLYDSCGTVIDHEEHIALVESLGLRHSPELKVPQVEMPFEGNYTHAMYAQQFIDNYKRAGVPASRVMAQSFYLTDILYWIEAEPAFGRNALLLDQSGETPETYAQAIKNLAGYRSNGVRTIAPPLHYLVESRNGAIVPSKYARRASELGLRVITWSLERSGPLPAVHKNGDYYYTPIRDIVTKDGDMYELVDVLYKQAHVVGMFSDWSATVTFYANCFGIGL